MVDEIMDKGAAAVHDRHDKERQTCCTPTRGVMSSYCSPCNQKFHLVVNMSQHAKAIKAGKLELSTCTAALAERKQLLGAVERKRVMECPLQENGVCPQNPKRRRLA